MTPENETVPDEPLSPADHDLAQIAAASNAHDAYLLDLVELADNNLSTSVGLLVDGVFITGTLTSAKAIAEDVDQAHTWLANQSRRHADPKELEDDELQKSLNEFSTSALKAYEHYEQAIVKIHEEAKPYLSDDGFAFDKAPAAISRSLIKVHQRAAITLRDAQIVAPGQAGIAQLPVLRVAVAHIAAWWVIQLDPEGHASFQLFRVEQGQ